MFKIALHEATIDAIDGGLTDVERRCGCVIGDTGIGRQQDHMIIMMKHVVA